MFLFGFILAHVLWIALIEWRTGLLSDWFKKKWEQFKNWWSDVVTSIKK